MVKLGVRLANGGQLLLLVMDEDGTGEKDVHGLQRSVGRLRVKEVDTAREKQSQVGTWARPRRGLTKGWRG